MKIYIIGEVAEAEAESPEAVKMNFMCFVKSGPLGGTWPILEFGRPWVG